MTEDEKDFEEWLKKWKKSPERRHYLDEDDMKILMTLMLEKGFLEGRRTLREKEGKNE